MTVQTDAGKAVRRYELKYLVSPADALVLEARLSGLLAYDTHTRDGSYEVQSIYFDDAGDTHLKEVQDGLSDRSKWRIRFYNRSDRYISLERKRKRNAMTLKESCAISRADLEALMEGRSPRGGDALLRSFSAAQAARGYRPRVIIDYQRVPFIYPAGNVRITLDRQIRCGNGFEAPFDCDGLSIPVEGSLLEVKYADFMPDFIRLALQVNHLAPASFSKYAVGRQTLHYMTTGEMI